jgi:hypothetical protein
MGRGGSYTLIGAYARVREKTVEYDEFGKAGAFPCLGGI